MKKFFFMISALAVLATACQEKEVVPELTLTSPSTVTIDTEGGLSTVTFTTNVDWTASIDNTNFSVTPTSGIKGEGSVKVTALQNDSDDAVKATLTIAAGTATQKVEFTQLQKNCLSLTAEEAEVTADAQELEIEVLANVSYTVTPEVDWIKFVKTKGAVSTKAVVAIEANPGEAREGTVTISGEGKKAEFTVKQAAFEPYFNVKGVDDNGYVYAPVNGGTLYVQIQTNLEYTYKTYEDSSFPWQHVTVKKDEDGSDIFTIVIDANEAYDARTSYIKFTIPYIQDEVLDDNGDPTGETEDHFECVYVAQDGKLVESWAVDFTEGIALPSTYSAALFNGKLYVANALSSSLFAFDAATGTVAANVDLSGFGADYVNSIASDDKGNLVIAFGGNYPLEEGVEYIPLQIFAIPAGQEITLANAVKLVEYTNGFYGYGLDNIDVNGDVTSEAAISMVTAVGYDGGSYAVSWQVENGATTDSYTDYVTLPTGKEVWYSGDLSAIHSTSKVSDGIFYIGYDAHYDLCYNPGTSYENWQHILASGSSWAENYSGIDCVEWNGSKYIVFIGTAFFNYWGMPSYVSLVNVDDPTAPVLISKSEHYTNAGVTFSDVYVNETTGDVLAVVENGKLAVYFVDAGIGSIKKIVFDVL